MLSLKDTLKYLREQRECLVETDFQYAWIQRQLEKKQLELMEEDNQLMKQTKRKTLEIFD